MFKKTHIKTIMTFFIIGLIIITGLGIINVVNLNDIKNQIANIDTATVFILLLIISTLTLLIIESNEPFT